MHTSVKPEVHVVLVSPRNPLNIGAVARAMSNFGFFSLRLVNAYDVAFEDARSAVKAAALLQSAQQFSTLAEAVANCTLVVGTSSGDHRELRIPIVRTEPGLARAKTNTGPVALVFGSEKTGLNNDDISHCHFLVRIPSRPEHASINLGQAVAVTLYELIRENDAPMPTILPHLASAGALQRLEEYYLESLEKSGYTLNTAITEQLRRMIRRMEIPPHDAEIWLGMIRQILWKLKINENKE